MCRPPLVGERAWADVNSPAPQLSVNNGCKRPPGPFPQPLSAEDASLSVFSLSSHPKESQVSLADSWPRQSKATAVDGRRRREPTLSARPAATRPLPLAEGRAEARAGSTAATQRLVSYLVSTTPSGNVRVSTRLRLTQLSRAVKNGVPPPTRTGWVTIAYSSISPARMAAAASAAPPMSMGAPSSALSLVISVTASPVTRRVFQSTVLVFEENTTFGMSRQRLANSIAAGVAPGCLSAVGQWELIVSHSLRPYSARPVAPTRSDHHWNSSSLGMLQPRSSPGAAMQPSRLRFMPKVSFRMA